MTLKHTAQNVLVPISGVTMTKPQTIAYTVVINKPTTFECVTSGGLPAPDVRWYKGTGSSGDYGDQFIEGFVNSLNASSDGLNVTRSSLVYSPEIADSGLRIFCVANNTEQLLISNLQPRLNVQCEYVRYTLLK